MLSLSNTLSLLRMPLAFLFIFQSVEVRLFAIIAAMISDAFDGYFARKFNNETFLGKVLDPLMDKFFIYFVMGALTYQGALNGYELFALLARDFSILLYIITILANFGWKRLVFFPVVSSKITTLLQFLTLFAIIIKHPLPHFVYAIFIALGPLIYLELLINSLLHKRKPQKKACELPPLKPSAEKQGKRLRPS